MKHSAKDPIVSEKIKNKKKNQMDADVGKMFTCAQYNCGICRPAQASILESTAPSGSFTESSAQANFLQAAITQLQ